MAVAIDEAARRDRAILEMHLIRARQVQNAINSGLTAQDIAHGVTLTHEEYLDLVRRAVLARELQRAE